MDQVVLAESCRNTEVQDEFGFVIISLVIAIVTMVAAIVVFEKLSKKAPGLLFIIGEILCLIGWSITNLPNRES